MPLHLGWREIALRLGLAFVAATLIGLNRGRHGEAAGLRTTLLVCLAAAIAMVQTNLLLVTDGKTGASFSVMDVMRLPLGILTGIGFIGTGAILKRGNLVMGVTTAASIWFTTVMGLCFGGGQIGLGLASLGLGLVVLSLLKCLERRWRRERRATLVVAATADGITRERIEEAVRRGGFVPLGSSLDFRPGDGLRTYEFIIGWRARGESIEEPPFLGELARDASLRELKWRPDDVSRAAATAPE